MGARGEVKKWPSVSCFLFLFLFLVFLFFVSVSCFIRVPLFELRLEVLDDFLRHLDREPRVRVRVGQLLLHDLPKRKKRSRIRKVGVDGRVARWPIFKSKILNWVNLGRSCN
jgi:hypothetical protein